MKSSAKGFERRRSACLIVDGYNIIARMENLPLRQITHVELARDELVERLQEYAAFADEDVILVFDAHQTRVPRHEERLRRVTVIYTEQQETADSRIERLVYDLRDTYRQITVATSDFAEQQVIFGGGALRISANGLIRRLEQAKYRIRNHLEQPENQGKTQVLDTIRHDVANILEKWRRR